MAAGSSYPVDLADASSGVVRDSGTLIFTDSAVQPQAVTNPTVSGTLPNSGAWVSGMAKVNPVSRQITMVVEVVGDATNAAATCTIAISPDNSTFTTIATPSIAAALNNLGALKLDVPVTLPKGWYIKLTIGANATVAASIYW